MNVTQPELHTLTSAALAYADAGYYVFPVSISINPDTRKKSTRFIDSWTETSTRDGDTIRGWFESSSWDGLAIDCGKSGIVAVDLDVSGDKDGESEWANLPVQQDTPMMVLTQSGGRHLIYRDPSGLVTNSASEVAPGVDIRGKGGLVFTAPTRVRGGGSYSLTGDLVPVVELPDLTDDMVRVITARQGNRSTSLAKQDGPYRMSEERAEAVIQSRLDKLSEGAGMRAAIFGAAACIAAFEAGKSVRDGDLLDTDSLTAMIEATILQLVPWDSLDEDDSRWITEGVEKGMAEPWEIVSPVNIEGSALQQIGAYQPLAERLSIRNCTESENAERIAEYVHGYIHYVNGMGWHIWNGRVWEANEGAVRELVRQFNKLLWEDLAEVAKTQEGGPKGEQLRFVQSMNKANGIAATVELLRNIPGMTIREASRFDANPYVVSVANGTIDLRTGTLKPHDRGDLLTMMIPIDYHPDATAPRWDRFMCEVFPKQPETPAFLQRLFGYSLTGLNREHIFPVFNGKGRNGKSVMLDVLGSVFGPLATKVLRGAFDADSGSTQGIALAGLKGKRLALMSETNDTLVMDEALVKEATGDARITGRHLYSSPITFDRQFQLVLVTNHRPDFRSQGEALWDRVRLVEFERYFAAHEREKGLDQYLITHEAEGILAWLVRGAIEYFRIGLAEPDAVLRATKLYQAETDKLAEFIEDRCVVDPAEKVVASELWMDYNVWAPQAIGKPEFAKNRSFYAAMEEKGFTKAKGTGNKVYVFGLRLKHFNEL
jgi:P4 family phage/plasmid primase-like protien